MRQSIAPKLLLFFCFAICLNCIAKAQLCTGSLGDPVVNITFGAGPNPGPPLAAATTSYQYVNNACPVNGYYTVLSSGIDCSGYGWHVLAHDHTGNPNGYFMLVDASYQPSDFYLDTVRGLCAGTTFEFAAWILNMKNIQQGIRPNITFKIEKVDGTVLGSYNSGDVPPETDINWRQYGFYFTTPANTPEVVLRMTNNAQGGDGNDLALDDITFRPCGPLISPFFVNTNNDTAANFCLGDTSSITIGATLSGGYASPQYQWQLSTDNGATFNDIPGATAATYKRLATGLGTYLYRLTVAQQGNIGIATCRVASTPLTINVNPNPAATATNNGPKCVGKSITLTAAGGASYVWAGPNGFTAKGAVVTVANPADASEYFVVVTNGNNCSVVDSTVLAVYANPVAAFATALPLCTNSPVNFNNKSTVAAGQTITNYNWLFGDGGSSATENTSHIFTTAGTYPVSLAVTASTGCTDTVAQQLAIHYLPQAAFILPQVCLRDPFAQFTDASTIADGTESGFTYLWNFGDAAAGSSNSSALQNPRHSYTATGVYPAALTVTSSNGCVNDTTEQFTVNGAFPQAQLAFNNGDSLCSNTALIITNNSTVNFGSVTKLDIYWDYSNNPANEITDDSTLFGKQYQTSYPVFDNPAIKTYSIKYVAYSGISCVNELDTIITLKASPILAFDTIGPVCEGTGAFMLTQARETNSMVGTGVYSGSGMESSGLFTPAQAAIGTDSIYYTFTAGIGCAAAIEQTVKIYAQPTADAGPNRQLLQGGSLTINATADGDNLSYLWMPDMYLNDNKVLTPTVSPPVDIKYTITATSSDGCATADSMHITVLKTPLVPNAFSPNGDGINDTWVINYLSSYANVTVQVFNRYGQAVFFSNGYGSNWDGTTNGKPLPVGTYYYIIDRKIAGAGKLTGWVEIIR